MNRLVIVGNGFDLAHGLPTGYCDFIDWYWGRVFKQIKNADRFICGYEDDLISFDFHLSNLPQQILENFRTISNHLEYVKFIEKCSELSVDTEGFDYIEFKNSFFQVINHHHYIQNWVDIENEYYKLLKKCLKDNDNSNVRKLNKEFEQVKNLLEKYLFEEVCDKTEFKKYNTEVRDIFNIWTRFTDSTTFHGEFSKDELQEVFDYSSKLKYYNSSGAYDLGKYIEKQGLEIENIFLNFNYTPTVDSYISSLLNDSENYYGNSINLQIHGKLNDGANKINFGFGDEMDNHYKLIEEKDDNEYLRNIKSFQYLQNSNYKRLLTFVESKKFQVYVMGHSCGLSDRILLNTIFEHVNCKSIKVFYYKKGDYDNYTEIIQNISRHFNKKKLMREKIVNKTLCQPLPQIKLPLKENGSQS